MELFKGLIELKKDAFPKYCPTCKRVFKDVDEYIKCTKFLSNSTGLKESEDDSNKKIIELFRNCPCGSTLMSEFKDRRDTSPEGDRKRRVFNSLLKKLIKKGLDEDLAKEELRKLIRGQESKVLEKFMVSKKRKEK